MGSIKSLVRLETLFNKSFYLLLITFAICKSMNSYHTVALGIIGLEPGASIHNSIVVMWSQVRDI